MKVDIEVQYLCTKSLRGIPYYMINLVESLVKRNQNEYTVSFYDYQKERNNRAYIEEYLAGALSRNLRMKECNFLSYKAIIEGNENGDTSSYDHIPYNEYFGEKFDVYHFPHVHNIPRNIVPKTVVTVHDILPVIPEFAGGWDKKTGTQFNTSLNFVKQRDDVLIIADSICTKKDLIEYMDISSERIHVVPLAYDTQVHYVDKQPELLSEMGINGPYILYLGVLDFRKGIVNILDAFEILKSKNKDIKLVLAGELNPVVTPVIERLKGYKYIDSGIVTFVSPSQ